MNTDNSTFFAEEKGLYFHTEDIDFFLEQSEQISSWIEAVIRREAQTSGMLNFIFCSDDYLHELNVNYLDQDTLTDIITFPFDEDDHISGDIFISIARVRENAKNLELPFTEELHRVMIHGILHLCGYGDKSPEEASTMRQKENESLLLLQGMD